MPGRAEGVNPTHLGPLPTQNSLEAHLKLAVILRGSTSILILP